ncbi:MAG: hypothetical protein WA063_01380 [Minisyncoccia bacterium]
MRKKVWMYCPKKEKPQLSEDKKAEIIAECWKFIDSDLFPYLAKNFNKKTKRPRLAEIKCKWNGNFLYFIAYYENIKMKMDPSDCEEKFARLEYQENNKFLIAYFRHTGAWFNLNYNDGISLKECFKMILKFPNLQPIGF